MRFLAIAIAVSFAVFIALAMAGAPKFLESALASAGSPTPTPTPAPAPTPTLNVMDYGAKHDNVSDDVAAIKSAVAAAVAVGGGTVYLPAGTYMLYANELIDHPSNSMRANLVLRDHVTFKGDGIGRTILRSTAPSYTSCFGSTYGTDLHVEDMTLTTSRARHAGDGDGIKLQGIADSSFTNVYAEYFYIDFMIYGSQNVTFTGCKARGGLVAGTGTTMNFVVDSFSPSVFPYTDNILFDNCESYESQQCGFWAYIGEGTGSDSFRVNNVTYKNCYAHDNDGAGFYSNWSDNCTWEGCTSNNNGWAFLVDHAKDYYFTGCTASGNSGDGNASNGNAIPYIYATSNARP